MNASSLPPSNQGGSIGVVVIGRNEGSRLIRSLESVARSAENVVYVDSGSTDDSIENASRLGVRGIELDASLPFSAGRARNAGFEALSRGMPGLEFVQFLDGDTELSPGWLEAAASYMRENPDVALVSGELRERDPQASLFNRLAGMEWKAKPGEIRSAGGNAMLRVSAFRTVGGYRPEMIAGEDPEICIRIRCAGNRVVQLDREMGRHDADMLRLRQWWRRSVRDGHAYAEILYLHRRDPEPYWVRRVASIVVWGGAIPLTSVLGAWSTSGLSLLLLGAIVVQWLRIFAGARREGANRGDAALYASHCVVGKVGQFGGVALFVWNRAFRRRATRLIEHKDEGAAG